MEKNLADENAMINEAFLRLTGKNANSKELKLLAEIHNEQFTHYQAKPTDAEKLINLGDTTPPADLDKAKLAAMTIVCQAIMNLDAAIWKR
jgi:predicted TIM-barrel enzyme